MIDVDHWRHFYLLMALVWGLMLGDRRVATLKAAPSRPAKIKTPMMIIPARRAPRIVGRARVRLTPLPAPAQRRATLRPRLPNRIGRS